MRFALLELIAPVRCAGCGAGDVGGGALCAGCAPAFSVAAWRVPARPPPGGAGAPWLPPLWASATYAGPVPSAIVAYKERGRRDLAPFLADLLTRSVTACVAAAAPPRAGPVPPVILVPVPTRRAAAVRRGDHPVGRLAGCAARAVGGTVLDVLRYRRPVADQAGLRAAERAANLGGAFHVPPRLRREMQSASGALVIVVDDVCTTGATLAEAGRALAEAGCRAMGSAVAATTVLRVGRGRPRVVGDVGQWVDGV
jgi:predicted amidophosphoribosyltransferase